MTPDHTQLALLAFVPFAGWLAHATLGRLSPIIGTIDDTTAVSPWRRGIAWLPCLPVDRLGIVWMTVVWHRRHRLHGDQVREFRASRPLSA